MRAMVLEKQGAPLVMADIPRPTPAAGEVLVEVRACGVCRTDLHILDGDLPDPALPLVMGHQIVGVIVECGQEATGDFSEGERIGVGWLGGSCGKCDYCLSGRENLCDLIRFTGYRVNGGYGEYCVADARFAFRLPREYDDLQAAPLLCAGLVGWRAFRMTVDVATGKPAQKIGFYGFGSSAHILAQAARHLGREVYAFVRPGDEAGKAFAESLGAVWAGGSDEKCPDELDAAIIFAPVGKLVPTALEAVRKGGVVVCAGIHMSDIPSFPYSLLWGERVLRSVANLTRRDGDEFLELAATAGIKTTVRPYPLERANDALEDLRNGRFEGSAVLVVGENT